MTETPETPASRATDLRAETIAVVVLVACVLGWFARLAFGDAFIWWRDALQLGWPDRVFIRDELAAGRLPFWDPFQGAGLPFWGELTPGPLHPINLAVLPLPPLTGFAWNFVLAFLAAALGTYGWLRTLGVGRVASVVGGLLFLLSGPILTQTNLQYLVAHVTVPWALWATAWAVRRGGTGPLLVAAVAFACLLFAGDPQAVLVAGAIAALDAVLVQPSVTTLVRLAVVSVGGGLLSAVQLLPASEAFGSGLRDVTGASVRWNLVPRRLLDFLLPDVHLSEAIQPLYPEHFGVGTVWTPRLLLGAAVVLLAVVSVRAGRRVWAYAGAVLVLVWLAFGEAAGLERVVEAVLPIWKGFRYGEKLLAYVGLLVAAMAAIGLERQSRRPSRVVAAVALVLGLVGIAVSFGSDAAGSSWSQRVLAESLPAGASLVTFGAVLGALAWRRASLPGWAPSVALAVSVVVPLALQQWGAVKLAPKTMFEKPVPLADALREQSPGPVPPRFHVYTGVDQPDVPRNARGEPLDSLEIQTLLPTTHVVQRIGCFVAYHPAQQWGLYLTSQVSPADLVGRVMPTFGVTHVATLGRVADFPTGLERTYVDEAHGIQLFRGAPTARAYVARRAFPVPSDQVGLDAIFATKFRPVEDVALEADVDPADATDADRGSVRITAWHPQEYVLEASLTAPGWVVVNEAWDAGWEAQVDGEPLPLVRANGLVQALKLPAGSHTITLRYTPTTATLGAAISALTLLGWLLVMRRRSGAA